MAWEATSTPEYLEMKELVLGVHGERDCQLVLC